MGASSRQARRRQTVLKGSEVPAELTQQFARFRRAHPLGTRVPDELRAAVCRALAQGVGRGALQRALGLGGKQLDAWQRGPAVTQGSGARIFEVKDAVGALADDEVLELRVGGFSVVIHAIRAD